ncbi:MAG TPA: hydrogenase maturation protease [Thiobacillus sp.]
MCIFGIGSPSGDDQAGWLTVDALLASGLHENDATVIEKLDRPGVNLIPLLEDAAHVLLVDAMQGGGEPGRILRLDEQDWSDYRQGVSSHGFGVLDALLLARELGGLPPRLDLYGIEIGSASPGAVPGEAVQAAAQRLARRIARELAVTPL